MKASQLEKQYNYDAFIPENVNRWLNFDSSPPLGEQAPDFPLWNLEEMTTRLSNIWSQNLYTVVEFGSFT